MEGHFQISLSQVNAL